MFHKFLITLSPDEGAATAEYAIATMVPVTTCSCDLEKYMTATQVRLTRQL